MATVSDHPAPKRSRNPSRSDPNWLSRGPNTLDSALLRNSNNFDLLRLILAVLVIFSHSHAIQPALPQPDPIARLLPVGDSGQLAVIVFFVLSGLFVTDSLLSRQSLARFAVMRVCRILPGLLVCLLATAFIEGPVFTVLPAGDYFRSPETLSYIYRNLALTDLQWRLPGVFAAHAFGLNGSLWTLPTEIRLYVACALLYAIGSLERRSTALLAVAACVYLFHTLDPTQDPATFRLIVAFAAGGALATCKTVIPLHRMIAVALALVAAVTLRTGFADLTFLAAITYALLFAFTRPLLRRLRLPGDYSYGVYIYGFPIQQAFAQVFPAAGPLTSALCSALLALALGALSWRLVERPAMVFGRMLSAGTPAVAPALVLIGLGVSPLALRVLPGWGHIDPVPSDLRIASFGPEIVIHGQSFNVQPDGKSALWAKATRPITPGARLIVGGVALNSEVSGGVITATVPAVLFRDPAMTEIAIQEQRDGRPSPSVPVIWDVR